MGPLRNLTVQSKTRARYNKAMERYRNFLREETDLILEMPRAKTMSFHTTSNTSGRLARVGLSPVIPSRRFRTFIHFLRGHLPSAWRLLKTWSSNELPNRAPPLPLDALHVLTGYALFIDKPLFALSLAPGIPWAPAHRGAPWE